MFLPIRCKNPLKYLPCFQFRRLTLGYENTTVPEVLSACLRYLEHHLPFYPGEGEVVLDLLYDVIQYMNFTRDNRSLITSAQDFYKVINVLLGTSNSVISTKVSNVLFCGKESTKVQTTQMK